MALVDAVEALEDAALVGIRDADAGIHDGERDGLAILPDGNGDAAAGDVILDRIVAEVVDHFLQQLLNAFNHSVLAGQGQRDILFLRNRPQALDHLAGQRVQVDRRFGEVRRAFVQPRQLDDIVDKVDQPPGLAIDIAGELLHLFLGHHALLHQLGKARDGGQRRLELVRHVGREFPAQRLALLTFGHVHEDDDRAGHMPGCDDRVGKQLPGPAADGDLLVAARTGERVVDQIEQLAGADCLMQVFRLLRVIDAEQAQRAAIARKDAALVVDDEEALAHVLRDGVKLALAGGKLAQLGADGAVLLLQAGDERLQLRIGRGRVRIIGIDGVDGPDDLPRQPHGKQAAQNQHEHDDPQRRLHQHQRHGRKARLLSRHTQDCPVLQQKSIIVVFLQDRGGIPVRAAAAGLKGFGDLRPLEMVFHRAGVRHIVIEDRAVCRDPGDALAGLHGGKIRLTAADLHALGDMLRLDRQIVECLRLIIGIHDKEEQQDAREQNGKANQECIAEDLCGHAFSPPIL